MTFCALRTLRKPTTFRCRSEGARGRRAGKAPIAGWRLTRTGKKGTEERTNALVSTRPSDAGRRRRGPTKHAASTHELAALEVSRYGEPMTSLEDAIQRESRERRSRGNLVDSGGTLLPKALTKIAVDSSPQSLSGTRVVHTMECSGRSKSVPWNALRFGDDPVRRSVRVDRRCQGS